MLIGHVKNRLRLQEPTAYAFTRHSAYSSQECASHVRKKVFVDSFVEKISIFSYINNVEATKF
jgi:hypothetical protein